MTKLLPKKIEDLLDWKQSEAYSLKNHSIIKVLREVRGSSDVLYQAFTDEIKASKAFRETLNSSLGSDISERPRVASHWVMFLKPRINVMEHWSTMYSTFAAIFALAAILLTSHDPSHKNTTTLIFVYGLPFGGAFLFFLKFHIDKRVFWYKFVVSHLENIANKL